MPLLLYPCSTPDVEEESLTSDMLPPTMLLAPAQRSIGEEYEDHDGGENDGIPELDPGDVQLTQYGPPMLLDNGTDREIEVIEGISPGAGADSGVEVTQLSETLRRSETMSLMSISTGIRRFAPPPPSFGESLAEHDRSILGSLSHGIPAAQRPIPASPVTLSMDPVEYIPHGPTIEFQRLSWAYLDKLKEFCQRILQHWQIHCSDPRFRPYFELQERNLENAARFLRIPHIPGISLVERRREALRKFFQLLDKWEENITHDVSCAYVPEYKDFCLELAKGKEVIRVRFGEFNLWCQIIKRHTGETYAEIACHNTDSVELIDTLRRLVPAFRSRVPRPIARSATEIRERRQQENARMTVIPRRELSYGLPASPLREGTTDGRPDMSHRLVRRSETEVEAGWRHHYLR